MHVSRGPPDSLDQRSIRAQEALFIRIQDGHQRDFRHVEAFAQQVDTDQDVKRAQAQIANDFRSFDSADVGMQVAHPNIVFLEVIGQIFRHPFGQRCDQHALVSGRPLPDFRQNIVDLGSRRTYLGRPGRSGRSA